MNIIRVCLPDKTYRYKPLSVAEYRDYLFVRNDLDGHDQETKKAILNEMLEELFPDIPPIYRGYAFIRMFSDSIGRDKIPMTYKCPYCGTEITIIFDVSLRPLTVPVIDIQGMEVKLKYVDSLNTEDMTNVIMNCIESITRDGIEYKWEELDDETKSDFLSLIDYKEFESIIEKINPLYFKLKFRCSNKECKSRTDEDIKEYTEFVYNDIVSLFEILIHPDEIYTFYQINHLLNKNNYTIGDVLAMMPSERGFVLSLVERDLKNRKE